MHGNTALSTASPSNGDTSGQGTERRRPVAVDQQDSDQSDDSPEDTDPVIAAVLRDLSDEFLEVVPDDVIKECVQAFIRRTGNDALGTRPCAACARIVPLGALVEFVTVDEIPNHQLLRPFRPHRMHNLVRGLLLHDSTQEGSPLEICSTCFRRLKANKLPPLALANNMWIGAIPFQLRVLTLAERILVARYYPAVYIVKLYPKDPSVRYWDPNTLNNGLKGNVSTYPMDPNATAKFMNEPIMPPPASVLSATIGVTLIGPRGFPERTMPDILRVRRSRVRDALEWLRENNPLYADIQVSADRLDALPEDGIPDEIMSTTRYSTDMDAVNREHETYVPQEEEEPQVQETFARGGACDGLTRRRTEATIDAKVSLTRIPPGDEKMSKLKTYNLEVCKKTRINHLTDQTGELTSLPCKTVFPIHSLGTIDVTGCTIPDAELMAHALANTAAECAGADAKVRRGSSFVNEYARRDPETGERTDGGTSNPNHLLGSFPWLFPYGCGGFEVKRAIDVPYETHVKWALMYADRRFREDIRFIFQVFGVIQKRSICRAASIHISKPSFTRHRNAIALLTEKDFALASKEEAAGKKLSNTTMRVLREEISTVRVQLAGSDESRVGIRRKIWGATALFGPPTIWLTVNPSDTHDPIVQFLAGEDIDLDNFDRTTGPSSSERATNVAKDPYAAAQFFHHVILAMLEEVFGITGAQGSVHVKRKKGILGTIQGYVGTVEAQGRGTLHLHAIIWLRGAPSADKITTLLKSATYRERVKQFIRAHISADIDGLSASEVAQLPRENNLAYSRPLNPDSPNYEDQCKARERQLARSVQYHQCTTATCLRMRNGRLECKRRAPFELSSREWITVSGHWGPKRLCGNLNNYNRWILQLFRSNHDIKLITSGLETRDIGWYITNYAAKKQKRSSNISALLARRFAFHQKQERGNSDIQLIHKRMIERCANTVSKEQEFSAPEVISYLMGWGDRYISHVYRVECVNGKIKLNDQLGDYLLRGDVLEESCFFDFLLNTYDGAEIGDPDGPTRRGRRPNIRVPYRSEDRKGRCRVIRSEGHECLPEFIGRWLPSATNPEENELYAASMLLLFKPWRNWEDIKGTYPNCKEHFNEFIAGASSRLKNVIANIQYFHSSKDSRRTEEADHGGMGPMLGLTTAVEAEREVERSIGIPELTEGDVDMARRNAVDAGQHSFAQGAMLVAHNAGVFNVQNDKAIEWKAEARRAGGDDELAVFSQWSEQLVNATRQGPITRLEVFGPETDVTNLHVHAQPQVEPGILATPTSRASKSTREGLGMLNQEQRRAHDIVEDLLIKHLSGARPDQLLMSCFGEGGTGKTTLIRAITDTFAEHNASHLLAKTATSGVAATLIGGETLHSWLGIGIGMPKKENWIENARKPVAEKRRRNMAEKLLLIIDECSMLTSEFLGLAAEVITATRIKNGDTRPHETLGGLNVVLFGDFHQFPPVARANLALYRSTELNKRAMLGNDLYRRFNTVVLLRRQNRVRDNRWNDLLRRLREGACLAEDMEIIKRLQLTNPDCELPDFTQEPWKDAILVTSRVEVKNQWNAAALEKHSRITGNRTFVVPAEDRISSGRGEERREPTTFERVLIAGSIVQDTGRLAERVELAVGMKAMVLLNIATEVDLANGTRGTIEEIVLDPREPPETVADNEKIWLKYPPALVKFRPETPPTVTFGGLDKGLIPITPSEVRFTLESDEGRKAKVVRRQLALTQAYAFTDYKSQGQTIPCVVVDLAQPPDRGSKLTPFSAYVALSRSRGRDTIRILRHYDESLFTTHPSEDLAEEDIRLAILDQETKRRWE
ncbi:hypothetical protein NP233_g1995 [Leucocoprinus birnbaumii]|uniref:ATP-dependent DNA helicase n=1 Tax=Leucocoprinus birnbaumii TaxID=56174 RepID=A0AAD5W1J7_9AGAR|nr:hypothetical protein NP233_g1995 [Leucocoprinus birnbaumii]